MTSQELISVDKLLPWSFNIPLYQRGFRWKNEQVQQLLDDLNEFRATAAAPFYFFQALVIAERNESRKDAFNVVDGQQRLTTINLLLNALNQTPQNTQQPKQLSLTYERSPDGQTSLGALDEHYSKLANVVIQEWIKKNPTSIESMRNNVLGGKFLVYRVKQEDELETFSRLNSGKIRAKDSELIKSVMLTPQLDEPFAVTQARAQEWDAIERALNHDPFFSFFTARGTWKEDDRMAVLLKWAGLSPNESEKQKEVFPFLVCVQKKIKGGTSRADLWKSIYTAYYRLAFWYDDPLMYHAVGWLIHRKGSATTVCLSDMSEAGTCQAQVGQYPEDKLLNIFYENPLLAHNYLLLFNVAYCWRRWPMRYDFCRHRKSDRWSLEHIFARNQGVFEKKDALEQYLNAELSDMEFQKYREDCKNNTGDQWLHDWLIEKYGDKYPQDEDNSLGNLALLGQSENASLNNGIFMAKREDIVHWPHANKYWASPATEAVFLKAFPGLDVSKQYWSKPDREVYVKYMAKQVDEFSAAIKNQVGTTAKVQP